MYQVTGIAIHELTNKGIDAESIFPVEMKEVNLQLNSADNYSEMIEIVETFMLLQINRLSKKINSIDHISRLIFRNPEKVSLINHSKRFFCTDYRRSGKAFQFYETWKIYSI